MAPNSRTSFERDLLAASDPVATSYVLAASKIATIVESSSLLDVWARAAVMGSPNTSASAVMAPYLSTLRFCKIMLTSNKEADHETTLQREAIGPEPISQGFL